MKVLHSIPTLVAGFGLLAFPALQFAQQSQSDQSQSSQDQSGSGRRQSQSSSGSSGTYSGSQSSSTSSSSNLSAADRRFLMKAASGGMAEVELGRMATQKGNSQSVKDFGQHMIDDHTKANQRLKDLASQKGVTLPSDMDSKDRAMVQRMSKLSGDQFDRAYMQHMTRDHREDIAEFQKEATAGSDPDIKAFANESLPTLQQHLQMAQSTGMGGTHNTGSHHGSTSATGSSSSSSDQQNKQTDTDKQSDTDRDRDRDHPPKQ